MVLTQEFGNMSWYLNAQVSQGLLAPSEWEVGLAAYHLLTREGDVQRLRYCVINLEVGEYPKMLHKWGGIF